MAIEFRKASEPKKSTSARKDVHRVLPEEATVDPKQESENQASRVDTPPKPKMGRPRTGYIKAEYNRQYSADQRTIKRLGLNCTVAEFRKAKEK